MPTITKLKTEHPTVLLQLEQWIVDSLFPDIPCIV